jgi:hypothetical protein
MRENCAATMKVFSRQSRARPHHHLISLSGTICPVSINCDCLSPGDAVEEGIAGPAQGLTRQIQGRPIPGQAAGRRHQLPGRGDRVPRLVRP